MPHTFKHMTHDESLVVAAAFIDLAKRHKAELYESLTALDPEYTDQERKDMINEILINIAEDFDLSADLVIPGEGYRRSQKRIFQDIELEFGTSTQRKSNKTKKLQKSERVPSSPPSQKDAPSPKDGPTPRVASQSPTAGSKQSATHGTVQSQSRLPSESPPPSPQDRQTPQVVPRRAAATPTQSPTQSPLQSRSQRQSYAQQRSQSQSQPSSLGSANTSPNTTGPPSRSRFAIPSSKTAKTKRPARRPRLTQPTSILDAPMSSSRDRPPGHVSINSVSDSDSDSDLLERFQ